MYGIVLSRRDFREVDQIISVFTAEKGMQEYIARGVKKITGKNTSHLEPCSLVSFGVAEGKQDFSYLTNVQSVEQFFSIRSSLSKLHIVGYCIDSLMYALKNGGEDSDIYHFILSFFRFLDRTKEVRLLLLDGFLIKFFSYLGYKPILDACVVCKKTYKDIGSEFLLSDKSYLSISISKNSIHSLGWYFAGGGIICSACLCMKQDVGERVLICGLKEVHSLEFLLRSKWDEILAFVLDKQEYTNVHKLIYEFVLYHSEKKWDDWRVLSNF